MSPRLFWRLCLRLPLSSLSPGRPSPSCPLLLAAAKVQTKPGREPQTKPPTFCFSRLLPTLDFEQTKESFDFGRGRGRPDPLDALIFLEELHRWRSLTHLLFQSIPEPLGVLLRGNKKKQVVPAVACAEM